MANEIQELLKEIKDDRLKGRLSAAVAELRKTKKFGLVFEEHLPELLPIYSAKVRSQARVSRRDGRLTETFTVQRINKGVATLVPESGSGEPQEMPVAELVVVKRFGEAIFPALRHVESVLRGGDAPHHTLIEADNYHALQLLEWLYAGKVDCIYIDPPYNTGARDWKYNNDYVDKTDGWRHSKWLSMMQRRLELAVQLLKPDGVLCVTIDDYEAPRLQCLLQDYFPEWSVLGVTLIRNNPSGRATVSGFSVTHEFALFVGRKGFASIKRLPRSIEQWNRYREVDGIGPYQWLNFRKDGGAVTYRKARPKQFYPVYIFGDKIRIPKIEWDKGSKTWIVLEPPTAQEKTIWPIDAKGDERVWSYGHKTARLKLAEMEVRRDDGGSLSIFRKNRPADGVLPRTWWDRSEYSAREYGTTALKAALGDGSSFQFAKSPYAVRDCLLVAGCIKHDAIIVDFFAGSGTTLNAVNLLNATDGGHRRCVLVTNNEVSDAEASALKTHGLRPGDPKWEAQGVCRSVTWPRSKFTIDGCRDDGSELPGEYLTGRFEPQETRRVIRPLDFTTAEALAGKKAREALAMVVGFTKSKVTGEESFFLAEDESVAALLDPAELDSFVAQGEELAAAIETVYLPFPSGKVFNQAKDQLTEDWPPQVKTVELKRPMKDGFAANLDYFRLDFLDRSLVETGGKLADILPALWMMAGCRGKLPTCKGNEKMLLFKNCPFAVLVEESTIKPFLAKLEERPDVDWAFIVTNDQDSFSRMCEWLPERIPAGQRVHLWRNYVDNFLINVVHPNGGSA